MNSLTQDRINEKNRLEKQCKRLEERKNELEEKAKQFFVEEKKDRASECWKARKRNAEALKNVQENICRLSDLICSGAIEYEENYIDSHARLYGRTDIMDQLIEENQQLEFLLLQDDKEEIEDLEELENEIQEEQLRHYEAIASHTKPSLPRYKSPISPMDLLRKTSKTSVLPSLFSLCVDALMNHVERFAPSLCSLPHLLSHILEQEFGFAYILLIRKFVPNLENSQPNLDDKNRMNFEISDPDSATIWQKAAHEAAKFAENAVKTEVQEGKMAHPFCIAAWKGGKEMLKEMEIYYTRSGTAQALKMQHIEFSPLFWAAKSGNLETFRTVLAMTDDCNVSFTKRSFHPMFRSGNRPPISINGNYGTVLSVAVEGGHIDVVREVLNSKDGKDLLEKKEPILGRTPLMIAVENSHKEITTLLLNHGANKNMRDKCGWTPALLIDYYWATSLRKLVP